MIERKNTLVLFSKPPVPGLVKTRLTVLKDGRFQPEVASALYHCMLFDVVEIICAAFDDLDAEAAEAVEAQRAAGNADDDIVFDTYELLISTTPKENVQVMEDLFAAAGTWPRPLAFTYDEGANFDIHYNMAFDRAWERGASCILSMGADMPALTKKDVRAGFHALHQLCDNSDIYPNGGIVLAPDQEMGVSVVGWPCNTHFDHTGVYYCQTGLTVLPDYIQKAREAGLPVLYLPPIPDVDTMADLRHNITLVEALNYCAEFDDVCPPWRTWNALGEMGLTHVRVMPNDLRDPREGIDK